LAAHPACGIGYHVYVYSTEVDLGIYGRYGSSGEPLFEGNGGGDEANDPYVVVDIGDMTDAEFKDKINEYTKWNDGLWLPPFNDCHTKLEEAFKHIGVDYPGWPGGRTWLDDLIFNMYFPLYLWLIPDYIDNLNKIQLPENTKTESSSGNTNGTTDVPGGSSGTPPDDFHYGRGDN